MFNANAIQFSKVLNSMLRTSGFSKISCLIFCCSSPPIQRIIVNSILAIIKTPSQFVVTSIPLFRFSNIRLEIHELWRDLWIPTYNTNNYVVSLLFCISQWYFVISSTIFSIPLFLLAAIDYSSHRFDNCFNVLLSSVNILWFWKSYERLLLMISC